MPTRTFNRTIALTEQQSLEIIKQLFDESTPARQLSKPVYSAQERDHAKELLLRCLSKVKKSETQ